MMCVDTSDNFRVKSTEENHEVLKRRKSKSAQIISELFSEHRWDDIRDPDR